MTNQRIGSALLIALTQAIACGGNSDGGPGGSSAGSNSGGMAAIAGTSAGGSAAGTANVAGTSAGGSSGGTPNAGGSGGSSSGALPSGVVRSCNGPGCPYGECNNSSTKTCTSVYPGEVGPAVPLCKADGDYCLGLGSLSEYHGWAIHCVGTTATATNCGGLCSYSFIDMTAQCAGG